MPWNHAYVQFFYLIIPLLKIMNITCSPSAKHISLPIVVWFCFRELLWSSHTEKITNLQRSNNNYLLLYCFDKVLLIIFFIWNWCSSEKHWLELRQKLYLEDHVHNVLLSMSRKRNNENQKEIQWLNSLCLALGIDFGVHFVYCKANTVLFLLANILFSSHTTKKSQKWIFLKHFEFSIGHKIIRRNSI